MPRAEQGAGSRAAVESKSTFFTLRPPTAMKIARQLPRLRNSTCLATLRGSASRRAKSRRVSRLMKNGIGEGEKDDEFSSVLFLPFRCRRRRRDDCSILPFPSFSCALLAPSRPFQLTGELTLRPDRLPARADAMVKPRRELRGGKEGRDSRLKEARVVEREREGH